MITVNCSEATLPSLLKTTELDRYRSHTPSAERKQVSAIVHRVPKAVLQDQAFQEWTETFGPTTQHLVALTDDYRHDATFTSSAKNVLQLSMLDEDIFPLLHAATPDTWTAPALPPNATLLQSGHQLKMQPKGQLEMLSHDRDVPYPSTPDGVEAARQGFAKDMPEYAAECAKAREAVRADPRWSVSSRDPGSDIVVTTLGTGSAIPSKYRNVSSTHLDVPGLGGILLDCGEGTLGQLRRRYGYDGLRKVYQELRMVFVSHMHADHHLGLQSILQDRFAVSRRVNGAKCLCLMVEWHHVEAVPRGADSYRHFFIGSRTVELRRPAGSAGQPDLGRQRLAAEGAIAWRRVFCVR